LLIETTLQEDGSIRLDKCRLDITELAKIDTFKLVDSEPDNKVYKTNERSGLTIQVPTVRSFRANIPEIVIPQGMALLVAFPGAEYLYRENGESYGAFLLITPQVIHGEATTDAAVYGYSVSE